MIARSIALFVAPLLLPASAVSAAQVLRDATVQGPHALVPATPASDEVPAPRPARYRAGPDGDVLIAPAGGDPHFLGFAGGVHYPPEGERIDPQLTSLLALGIDDGRPADEVFAFVMFSRRISAARRAQLAELGVRTFERHPHYALAAALPTGALEAVSELPFVRWVGVPRASQKRHPALKDAVAATPPGATLEVWVSLYESDLTPEARFSAGVTVEEVDPTGPIRERAPSAPAAARTGGWRERELEQLGFELVDYSEPSRSFRLRTTAGRIEDLVARDFVKFVSPVVGGAALHDESMAMIHADYTRASYDGGVNQDVIVGVVDSGITAGHVAFTNSWSLGADFTKEGLGAWIDGSGHGTHVAGTVLGRPDWEDSWAGAAPGVASWGPTSRFWNLKVIDSTGSVNVNNWSSVYNTLSTPWVDPQGQVTPIPDVVNHSWGSDWTFQGWLGTEPQAVDWDTLTYDNDQLHVFSAGNDGPLFSTLSIQASAKNVLSVGNVIDHFDPIQGTPGHLAFTSSRGPTGDDRWKPNLVAPGRWITSAGPNTVNAYVEFTGTSMAAPHVTGVAAQLLDHYAYLRGKPHVTSALLMATALTQDDVELSEETDSHLDNFGAGRVEAMLAHYETSQHELSFWGWEDMDGSAGVEIDIDVPSNATRLKVVLHYTEPAASVGASQALVNDWDLWIDHAPFTPGTNSGEYMLHLSELSNTELRMLDAPPPGQYRLKLHPDNVTSDCNLGLAVVITTGDTTPDGTLTITTDDLFVKPLDSVFIDATVTNPDHVASAVYLDSTPFGGAVKSATLTLKDGASASLSNNQQSGEDVLLGNILLGEERTVTWVAQWPNEGVHTFDVDATSDNWVDESAQVQITVDGTGPGIATGLVSLTHTVGAWSQNPIIQYYWNAAPDNLSGIDGYSYLHANVPTLPPASKNLGAVVSHVQGLSSSASPYWFNLRAVDRSGNWAPEYAQLGPFYIDNVPPSAVGALTSTTHTPGVASCATTVRVEWTAASDAHSGVSVYRYLFDDQPSTAVTSAMPATIGKSVIAGLGAGTHYFHVAAEDLAGNLGPTTHLGPFLLQSSSNWSVYCKAQTNSLGCQASMSASGCASLSGGPGLDVTATNLRNQKSAIVFWGTQPANNPFGGGTKCVANPVQRTPLQNTGGSLPFLNDCTGSASFLFDPAYLQAHGAIAGQPLYAQVWSRDLGAPGNTNLSGGLRFDVIP